MNGAAASFIDASGTPPVSRRSRPVTNS